MDAISFIDSLNPEIYFDCFQFYCCQICFIIPSYLDIGLDGLVDIKINLIITKRSNIKKEIFISKMVSDNDSVRFMCFLRINIEIYHKFVIIYRIFVIKLIINSVHISKMNHLFQIENIPILIYSCICGRVLENINHKKSNT